MEKLNYWREYKTGSVTVENTMAAPLKLKIELLFDPITPLLNIYRKELKAST